MNFVEINAKLKLILYSKFELVKALLQLRRTNY